MRKLTKKIFSTLGSERQKAENVPSPNYYRQENQEKATVSVAQNSAVNDCEESPTTSLRKMPATINKPPPINTAVLSDSFPRYLPNELPPDSFLQFMKMASFGTSLDLDGKPYTVYTLEVRSTMTMPSTWTVYRRFNQFCRLRQCLQETDGIKLPELPPRSSEFSVEQTMTKKRLLERWLHSIMEMHLSTPGMDPLVHNEHVRRFLCDNYNLEPPSYMTLYSTPCKTPSEHSLINTPASPGGSKVSIHDFNVVTTIGKGAFGQVFLVKSKRDATELYAMKSIRRKDIVNSRQYDIIERERKIMENLDCPFVVGLHYVLKTKESLFFILDYCAGGELLFHLSRLGRFPERTARFYCAELCLALEYLHDHDILYRDLKPENILLSATGHIKLVDFGLARSNISSPTTGALTYCGTEQYLAPEVLDRQDYGTAIDWWALGMILYEMLTGLPPWYSADNREEVFAGIRYGVLKFPRSVSRLSAMFIQALLHRDSSRRLGSGPTRADEVKSHPYFHDMDWIDLIELQVTPPIVPCLSPQDIHNATNFEDEFKRMSVNAFCHWDDLVDLPDSSTFGPSVKMTTASIRQMLEVADDDTDNEGDDHSEPAHRSQELMPTVDAPARAPGYRFEERGLFAPTPLVGFPMSPTGSVVTSSLSNATTLPSTSTTLSFDSTSCGSVQHGLEPKLMRTPLFASSSKHFGPGALDGIAYESSSYESSTQEDKQLLQEQQQGSGKSQESRRNSSCDEDDLVDKESREVLVTEALEALMSDSWPTEPLLLNPVIKNNSLSSVSNDAVPPEEAVSIQLPRRKSIAGTTLSPSAFQSTIRQLMHLS